MFQRLFQINTSTMDLSLSSNLFLTLYHPESPWVVSTSSQPHRPEIWGSPFRLSSHSLLQPCFHHKSSRFYLLRSSGCLYLSSKLLTDLLSFAPSEQSSILPPAWLREKTYIMSFQLLKGLRLFSVTYKIEPKHLAWLLPVFSSFSPDNLPQAFQALAVLIVPSACKMLIPLTCLHLLTSW